MHGSLTPSLPGIVGVQAALLDRYSEVLDQAKALLKEIDDVIEFQLTEMSNR